MENIETKIEGNKLTITVDLSKNLGRSKSGKTIRIASSEGNIEISPSVYMGLNIYRKD